MFQRLLKLPINNSFFIFGPRGSGKSTHLREHLLTPQSLYIDLLSDQQEKRYRKNPDILISDVAARPDLDWVVIDEIQKIPKLLDLVHKLIEEKKVNFALTGSSARKLKRDGANLLAGRAFILNMFPLTFLELKEKFMLSQVLRWGSLPRLFAYNNDEEKILFLNSYVKTYLNEEIISEQLVRNVEGFRDFLEIAAQMNGKIINFSKIGRESSMDNKTVKEYFQILEDTLVGFWVPGFHQSVRKAQKFQPKFYFFDVGVQRALEGSLDSIPTPGTSSYGQYFENYLFTEIFRANTYSQKNYKLSHYQTTTGQEIDLILSKGMKKIVVKIKSTTQIDPVEVKAFARLAEAFKESQNYFVSLDPVATELYGVRCLYYQDFIREVFWPQVNL
ncbi:MAG TPA: AAA family ATPase [Pseudobdellovibrionaceae bacterium]|jgi:predicted AAA+ superfamily ATPase